MNKVLMVALETPPCHSPGVQRTANFARTLPSHGWLPVVLSASESIYEYVDRDAVALWPPEVEIARAFGLDSSRHLAVRRHYWSGTATPDKYVTWLLPAVLKGLRLIRMHRPSAIWSTYPVATSHWVAAILARRTGLPWVGDYRDPAEFHYDPLSQRSRLARYVDRRTAEQAHHLVFTTDRARELYRRSYPCLSDEHTSVIENGFDEALHATILASRKSNVIPSDARVRLLHSGALYGRGRDPANLIRAVARLGAKLASQGRRLKLTFRGTELSAAQQTSILEAGAHEHVEFLPRLPFRAAFDEMFSADVLVLLQHELFDYQVPGKAYEYIASRRPIVAISSPSGATAALMRKVESAIVVGNEKVAEIADALESAISLPARSCDISAYGRQGRGQRLAELLDQVAGVNG